MDDSSLLVIQAIKKTIDLVGMVVIPFEILFLIVWRKSLLQREILVNICCLVMIYVVTHTADYGYKFASMEYLHRHAIFALPQAHTIYGNFAYVMAHVLMGDLCFYVIHRLLHTKYIFMLDHVVHHSSTELNFSTNVRHSFLGSFYSWVPFSIPLLLGFNPALLFACFALANAAPFFMHNDLIKKLGWLEYLFNTPSHHRVHHGSNPCYINKNFGGLLIVWDRLFGTYAEEVEPVVYGLGQLNSSANPFMVLFGGWLALFKRVRRKAEKLKSYLL